MNPQISKSVRKIFSVSFFAFLYIAGRYFGPLVVHLSYYFIALGMCLVVYLVTLTQAERETWRYRFERKNLLTTFSPVFIFAGLFLAMGFAIFNHTVLAVLSGIMSGLFVTRLMYLLFIAQRKRDKILQASYKEMVKDMPPQLVATSEKKVAWWVAGFTILGIGAITLADLPLPKEFGIPVIVGLLILGAILLRSHAKAFSLFLNSKKDKEQ